jgi:hypothetical protein
MVDDGSRAILMSVSLARIPRLFQPYRPPRNGVCFGSEEPVREGDRSAVAVL